MGKRLIDLFIVLIVLAALGVGGYFAYDTFLAEDNSGTEDSSTTSSSGTAQVTDSTLQLPPLDEAQLTALLPTVNQLPPRLSAAPAGEIYTRDLAAYQQDLATGISADISVKFGEIRSTYKWRVDRAIKFEMCALGQDVSLIDVEVSQLDSAATARAFIDDSQVRGFFQAMGYTLTEAEDVHGWYLTFAMPVKSGCYPGNEWNTALFFEHWGMLFAVNVTSNANTSSDVGRSVAALLASQLIANVEQLDVLTGLTIPPTPIPSGLAFDRLLSANVTPDTLGLLIPSSSGWDFANIYSSDPEETLSFSLIELVDFYRGLNTAALNQLAAEIDRAGRRFGLIAREIRAIKPNTECPAGEPARVDITLSLFERPAGAIAYMQDAGLQAAWRGTGLFSEFMTAGDVVYAYGSVNHDCGQMQIVQKTASYERLLYTISITVPTTMSREDARAKVDDMLDAALRNVYLRGL